MGLSNSSFGSGGEVIADTEGKLMEYTGWIQHRPREAAGGAVVECCGSVYFRIATGREMCDTPVA